VLAKNDIMLISLYCSYHFRCEWAFKPCIRFKLLKKNLNPTTWILLSNLKDV